MTLTPSVLIPVAPGTNRDQELAAAFVAAGATATAVPLRALREGEAKLADHQILAVPGGFSYGDALGAGRLLGLDLVGWFGDQLNEARARQMPVLGICNGFQALVRSGLLPGDGNAAALVANDSARFECRWVTLVAEHGRSSVWLDGIDQPLRCPVAHGEGRLAVADPAGVESTIGLRYAHPDGRVANGEYPANPNGSVADAAGLVDESGLVLGLMPHPEDHVLARQDPLRGRSQGGRGGGGPDGGSGRCLDLFRAGVAAVR